MNKKTIVGIAVGVIAAAPVIIKIISGMEPEKYSSKWFEKVADDVLNEEREIVRKQYVTEQDDGLVNQLYWLLHRFDKELSKRAWKGEEIGFPVHREHGWYLPNDD